MLTPIGVALLIACWFSSTAALSTGVHTTPPVDVDLAPPPPPSSLLCYDARYAWGLSAAAGYEELHLLAALSGLANRAAPSLFIWTEPSDEPWRAFASSPGGWLAGTSFVNVTGPVEALVAAVAPHVRGVVLWDPAVFATAAVASTSAGAEDLLPVAFRPDDPTSLYSRLVAGGPRLPVGRSLVGLFNGSVTGSVKRDVYAWAVDTFMRTGLSDGAFLAYYIDGWAISRNMWASDGEKTTVPNHDWSIARRAFFFDLSVWADEAPVDEPHQPLGSDLAAFRDILGACYNATGGGLTRIAGFTPWYAKYVAPYGKHKGVETEWATVLVTSAFNAFVDADACCIGNMANAALWSHAPLGDRYVQAPPPTEAALRSRGLIDSNGTVAPGFYYFFYAGDYDSSAWLASQLKSRWDDPARGTVPISWPVDPGLSVRFPLIFPHLYATLAAGDVLISGDSGAGYINPTMLHGPARTNESGLPDGLTPWLDLNVALALRFNLALSGFVINGDAPPLDGDGVALALYSKFSSLGLVTGGDRSSQTRLISNVPVIPQSDISTVAADAAAAIAAFAPPAVGPPVRFRMIRSVLTSPTFLKGVADAAADISHGATHVVDAHTLGLLARVALGGSNANRVAYVDDTLPLSAPAEVVPFSVVARNDGWNGWHPGGQAVRVTAVAVASVMAPGAAFAGGRGLASLDPQGVGSAVRRALVRQGFRGVPIAAAPWTALFPLTAATPPGANATVQVHLDATAASPGTLLAVTYEVVSLAPNGTVAFAFTAWGCPAWRTDVLVSGGGVTRSIAPEAVRHSARDSAASAHDSAHTNGGAYTETFAAMEPPAATESSSAAAGATFAPPFAPSFVSNTAFRREAVSGAVVGAQDGNIINVRMPSGVYKGSFVLIGMSYGLCPFMACANETPGACGFGAGVFHAWASPDLSQNSWSPPFELLPAAQRPVGIYFRPHVIYNAVTQQFVLWVRWLTPTGATLADDETMYLTAVADDVEGPYRVVNTNVSMFYYNSADDNLFVDADGQAYIVHTARSDATHIVVERLSADYTSCRGANDATQRSELIGSGHSEAAAMWRVGASYFVSFAPLCCYCTEGAETEVWTSAAPLGPYTFVAKLGNAPRAQQNFVFTHPDVDGVLWSGSRWGSDPTPGGAPPLFDNSLQFWTLLSPELAPIAWQDNFTLGVRPG